MVGVEGDHHGFGLLARDRVRGPGQRGRGPLRLRLDHELGPVQPRHGLEDGRRQLLARDDTDPLARHEWCDTRDRVGDQGIGPGEWKKLLGA